MGHHMGRGLVPPATGTAPRPVYPKGKPLELILDLGWYPHSCGGHIEGLVYRADGTAIKAVHPLNYWVPFMDAEGNAQVSVAEDGSFTLYLEAASNPLLLGVPPFVETELGDRATGKKLTGRAVIVFSPPIWPNSMNATSTTPSTSTWSAP